MTAKRAEIPFTISRRVSSFCTGPPDCARKAPRITVPRHLIINLARSGTAAAVRGGTIVRRRPSRVKDHDRPRKNAERANNPRFLDLFAEDSWRNVYRGELEVRPPGALTIEGVHRGVNPTV